MTQEERKFVYDSLFDSPSSKSRTSKEEFLRRFPSAVRNGKVDLAILEAAYETKNPEDVACALTIGFAFGFGPEHTDILCRLIDKDWHHSHEDAVSALDQLRSPSAVTRFFMQPNGYRNIWILMRAEP